ncbi:MAG: ABC transporter ATP-binding protein [Chloroflexi bacterium]|nr:ABC transporter ATP-binding protein [Chloroflexota bacterium]
MADKLAVETKDLTKVYDGATVVDRMNLSIQEGEVFGLLGPNGAGKTTTILMMLGLTEPASGTVRMLGFDPAREPLKVKRVVGYLPEKVGFYDNMTARENLQFIAELNGIEAAEADRRIDELLKVVGLNRAVNLTTGKFSRGMKQRLGIADVLIKKPKLVILDEPTSGLDPEGIKHLLDLIAALPKQGTTVILSSHQLYQVQRVCHSVGILSRGKLVVEGSIDKLGRDALAGGRYVIDIETAEPSPQLVDVLKGIKGVLKVELTDHMLSVTTEADLRAEIARVVVQNNVPLVQMRVQQFSLDDIYMRYFEESGGSK